MPVFYALEDTKYPLIAAFIAVAANILIINLTIDSLQHLAIALSTSCSMVLNFLFLSTVLYIKTGGYSVGYLLKAIGKIFVAGAGMAFLLLWSRDFFSAQLNGGLIEACATLLLLIGGAVILYTSLLHLMKLQELTAVTSKIRERFSR